MGGSATPTASGRLTCGTGSLLQRLLIRLPRRCEHAWRWLGWALPFPAREGEFHRTGGGVGLGVVILVGDVFCVGC